MRTQLSVLAIALTLGLATVGCAGTQQGTDTAPTEIRVENYHPLLVTVEAISDGIDYNLGQVETTDSGTFELPRGIDDIFGLRIRIDPVGSPVSFVSDEILYSPGDLIHVEVESDLDLTTVTVHR